MEASVSQLPSVMEGQPWAEPEQVAGPGVFARIGNVARRCYESTVESVRDGYSSLRQNADRYVAIGESVLAMSGGLAGAVEGADMALGATPAGANENVPALTSTAQAGNLQQQCATDIMKRPKVLHSDMDKPGKEYQDIFIQLNFGKVRDACKRFFKRLAAVRPQIIRHGKLINLDPTWDDVLKQGDTNAADPPHRGPGIEWFNSHHNPKFYYQKGDKVQFKLRLQELGLKAKKVVKTVIDTVPVKVRHN